MFRLPGCRSTLSRSGIRTLKSDPEQNNRKSPRYRIFLAALLALAPAASANVIDFNPNTGTIAYVGIDPSCPTCIISTYTENGIIATVYSNFGSLATSNYSDYLQYDNVNSAWELYNNQWFSATSIQLVGGGFFNVESFRAFGCSGEISAYNGAGVGSSQTASFSFLSYCGSYFSLYDVSQTPGWSDVDDIVIWGIPQFYPNVGIYVTDLTIDPIEETPEPSSLSLLGVGMAGLVLTRRIRQMSWSRIRVCDYGSEISWPTPR